MVEQLNEITWRSTLLPWATFDSVEAAEHYDNLEAQKRAASEERSKERLDKFSTEELRDIELTFHKNVELSSETVVTFASGELNRFALAHPKFVVTAENCGRLASYLLGRGFRYPFNSAQLAEAYSVLAPARQLDLK